MVDFAFRLMVLAKTPGAPDKDITIEEQFPDGLLDISCIEKSRKSLSKIQISRFLSCMIGLWIWQKKTETLPRDRAGK